jgi:uncharacterized membrane protein
MRPIRLTTTIGRPATQVFDFVSDFENNPRWQRGMRSCRWTSPPPHVAGATYDQVAHFLGRDVVSSFVVVEHEPGRRVKITSTSGSFPITETRSVTPIDDGRTGVDVRVEGDATSFFTVLAPLLRPLVRRSVRSDYRRLKTLLEGP